MLRSFAAIAALSALVCSAASAASPPGKNAARVEKWPTLPAKSGLLVQPLVNGEKAALSLLAIAPKSAVENAASYGDVLLWVLDGKVSLTDTKEKPLGRGDGAVLSLERENAVRNDGAKTAQVLVLAVPGDANVGFDRYEPAAPGTMSDSPGEPPKVKRAARAQTFEIAQGKGSVRMLFEGDDVPAYAGVLRAEPGLEVKPHQHAGEAEVLFILSGEGEMTVAGETYPVKPGMAIHIPPGTEHSFVQKGKKALEAVQFYGPPGPEQRFKPQPPAK